MGDSAAAAAAEATSNKFTCVMLLAVHGVVFLDDNPSQDLHPFDLKDIGIGTISGSRSSEKSHASVVSFVSPSNLGYTNGISSDDRFPNHVQRFIDSSITRDPAMDADKISLNFNLYDSELYEFFGRKLERSRKDTEPKATAKAFVDNGSKRDVSITKQMLAISDIDMRYHDTNGRMQTTRSALELRWKPHNFCIREKLYCPGVNANQCCLYFPDIDRDLHDRLRLRLGLFRNQQNEGLPLSSNLRLQFDSDTKCVLTIIFECDSAGDIMNKLWQYISLDIFFLNVKNLLFEIFNGVDGFNVEYLMSRTCVVDAACSNFSVPGKKASIISFKRDTTSGQRVSALIDVHTPSEHPRGFWEYWSLHDPAEAAKRVAAAARTTGKPADSNHRIVNIPRELEDFVPACLTCIGSTIKEIQPIFDELGNVVRVGYTYSDGKTEEKVYIPSERLDQSTESTEAVYGSTEREDFNVGDGSRILSTSVERTSDMESGGRRRWRRTLNKKCMKKCKTKRLRRRCKMTRKNAVKSRGRRTCVRRL